MPQHEGCCGGLVGMRSVRHDQTRLRPKLLLVVAVGEPPAERSPIERIHAFVRSKARGVCCTLRAPGRSVGSAQPGSVPSMDPCGEASEGISSA
jgi:hypothetical protein